MKAPTESQTSALNDSYIVFLELARAKKPFIDDSLVKKCAVEMAKAFGNAKIAEKFESVQLSNQTIQRRVTDMGEQSENSLIRLVEKSTYFSLCIDESTDQADVSQLIIFVRIIHEDFSTKEELLNTCVLRGTTKGKNTFEAVKTFFKHVMAAPSSTHSSGLTSKILGFRVHNSDFQIYI
ncbi:SCAN domain-containing protein 3-like [Tachypleus tridentatus]|uniref:SCAN domain-containing protein 3-like n=1 Tax=Tachypleus tridentatus TaxID=6853 RepID=UPI003FD4C3B7